MKARIIGTPKMSIPYPSLCCDKENHMARIKKGAVLGLEWYVGVRETSEQLLTTLQ